MFGFGRKKKETKNAKPAAKRTGAKNTTRKQAVKKTAGKKTAMRQITAAKPQKRTMARRITLTRKITTPVKQTAKKRIHLDENGKPYKLVPVVVKRHPDSNGGHNHVILEDFDDNHVSVGLTTRKTKGKNGGKNKPLKKDTLDIGQENYIPEKYSAMRRQGTVDRKVRYYDERKGSMVIDDFIIAREYGKRAKEKYLRNKKSNETCQRSDKSPSAMSSRTTRSLPAIRLSKPKPSVKIKKVVRKKQR